MYQMDLLLGQLVKHCTVGYLKQGGELVLGGDQLLKPYEVQQANGEAAQLVLRQDDLAQPSERRNQNQGGEQDEEHRQSKWREPGTR